MVRSTFVQSRATWCIPRAVVGGRVAPVRRYVARSRARSAASAVRSSSGIGGSFRRSVLHQHYMKNCLTCRYVWHLGACPRITVFSLLIPGAPGSLCVQSDHTADILSTADGHGSGPDSRTPCSGP